MNLATKVIFNCKKILMPLLDHTHASLRECSRMPSPLPVKGNTCIDDPDQSTDQIEDNSIQYGEIYVIELHKGLESI